MQKITTEFLPGIFKTPNRLVCRFGWNKNTTVEVKKLDFDKLILIGGTTHDFFIPKLDILSSIQNLELNCGGNLHGMNAFSGVRDLEIEQIPKNGISFDCFPKLEYLTFDWEKGLDEKIEELTALKEFSVIGYKRKNFDHLSKMKMLEGLYVTQGSLVSLAGLEHHKELRRLGLLYLRNLTSIEKVKSLKALRELYFTNLPKVTEKISISSFQFLEKFESHSKKLLIDLSNISKLSNLKMLLSTDECENLDVKELFSLRKLNAVSLPISCGQLDDQSYLYSLAKDNGLSIKTLQYVGSKKKKHIHILFE